jgi:hypothetical protein
MDSDLDRFSLNVTRVCEFRFRHEVDGGLKMDQHHTGQLIFSTHSSGQQVSLGLKRKLLWFVSACFCLGEVVDKILLPVSRGLFAGTTFSSPDEPC